MMRLVFLTVVWVLSGCGGCTLLFCAMAARAQSIVGVPSVPTARGHVTYVPEVADVKAGEVSTVELRFRVEDGFHVNSHTPTSELQIPTALTLSGPVAKVVGEEYPKGTPFRVEVGAGETLDVYQGEFRVRLRIVAPKGQSVLMGSLRYQACDKAACFPPKTLPVSLAVTAK